MNSKKKPKHPGKYIKKHVVPNGMSVKEAARILGVDRSTLSDLLNGKIRLSPAMASLLAGKFGADKEVLLKLQRKHDKYKKNEEREAQFKRQTPKQNNLTQNISVIHIYQSPSDPPEFRQLPRKNLGVPIKSLTKFCLCVLSLFL